MPRTYRDLGQDTGIKGAVLGITLTSVNPTPEPPSAPTTAGEAPTTAGDAPTPDAPARHSKWVMPLVVVAAIVFALCAGGLVVAYRTYDNATKPDRSTPDVAVNNYLRAIFDHRDDAEAAQYACPDQSGLGQLLALREVLDQRASKFSVGVGVSWQLGAVTRTSQSSATVPTTLVLVPQSSVTVHETQSWVLETRHGADWRVCAASEVSDSQASPSFGP